MALRSFHQTALALMGVILLAACKQESGPSTASSPEIPRNATLEFGGFDSRPTTDLQPFSPQAAWPVWPGVSLVYEPLLVYDASRDTLQPLLASSWEFRNDSLLVHIDKRARWTDGSPVSPQDAYFSLQADTLLHVDDRGSIIGISMAPDGVRLHLAQGSRHRWQALRILSSAPIVNASQWLALLAIKDHFVPRKDSAALALHPEPATSLTSGPYQVRFHDSSKVVLARNDGYWGNALHDGKRPVPAWIVHRKHDGDQHLASALSKGHIDVGVFFLPRVWSYEEDSVRAWSLRAPYYPAQRIFALTFGSHAPFNDVEFRKALAYLVDGERIRGLVLSNYSIAPGPGLRLPGEAADQAPGWPTYDPSKARQILKHAGYSWNAQGRLLDRNHQPLRPLSLDAPEERTTWENILRILGEGLDEVGIGTKEAFRRDSSWRLDMARDSFDISLRHLEGLAPGSPWNRYLGAVPDSLLALADSLPRSQLLEMLDRAIIDSIPLVPIAYEPTLYCQYSLRHWTYLPTEDTPYAPPLCGFQGAERNVLWSLKPTHP